MNHHFIEYHSSIMRTRNRLLDLSEKLNIQVKYGIDEQFLIQKGKKKQLYDAYVKLYGEEPYPQPK